MNPLLVASLAVGIGLFVAASAVPIGRASLAERLREFDVDVRVAERRRGAGRGVGLPIVSWEPLDALLRPLLEEYFSAHPGRLREYEFERLRGEAARRPRPVRGER